MPQVSVTLSLEEVAQLEDRAKALGLSSSAYVRQMVRDGFRSKRSRGQDQDQKSVVGEGSQKEIVSAIRALVPVLVEALARTSAKAPSAKEVEQLTTVLLEKWKEEVGERVDKGDNS